MTLGQRLDLGHWPGVKHPWSTENERKKKNKKRFDVLKAWGGGGGGEAHGHRDVLRVSLGKKGI